MIEHTLRLVEDNLDIALRFEPPSAVDNVVPIDRRGEGDRSVSIPIRFSDGELHGTLEFTQRRAGKRLRPRELQFLNVLASLIAQQLELGRVAAPDVDLARMQFRSHLDGGALSFVFQPIVDLSTGRPVGYEALARFAIQPPRPPDVWFTDAHAIGIGDEIELIAVRTALSKLSLIPSDMYLSVNISPVAALDARFHEVLASVDVSRVVLEVTEQTQFTDENTFVEAIAPLRARGLRLAVDDAGAGFANLLRILRLQPDVIKVDPDITQGIQSDAIRRSLVAALLSVAEAVGSVVVAEGIETEAQRDVVTRLGVPFGQGYWLGRPAPLALPA